MLEQLSGLIIHLITNFNYVGIYLLMLLESLLFPIPSEVTMPFAGFAVSQGHLIFIFVILAGALGNLTGSLLAYALGYFLEEKLILRLIDKYGKFIFLSSKEYQLTLKWFTKYGNSITFFSRLLPGVRTFVSLPAGLAAMNIWKFSLYTFLGSFVWSAFLTYIGFYLGRKWVILHAYFSQFQLVIVAVLLLLVLLYLNKHLKIIKFKQ